MEQPTRVLICWIATSTLGEVAAHEFADLPAFTAAALHGVKEKLEIVARREVESRGGELTGEVVFRSVVRLDG